MRIAQNWLDETFQFSLLSIDLSPLPIDFSKVAAKPRDLNSLPGVKGWHLSPLYFAIKH
jgi:hypothetical protein